MTDPIEMAELNRAKARAAVNHSSGYETSNLQARLAEAHERESALRNELFALKQEKRKLENALAELKRICQETNSMMKALNSKYLTK